MAAQPSQLGECIRLFRETRGMTQEDLAARSGISPEPIQRVEQRTKKSRAFGWHRRTLMLVAAGLHKATPLSEKDFERLLMAAKIPALQHRDVESTIRRMAGEFDGLQDRIAAKGKADGASLLDELLARQPKELFEIQAAAALMGEIYGLTRTLDALRAMKSMFDAEATRLKPPPGSVAHDSPLGARVITPTNARSPGADLKPRKQG